MSKLSLLALITVFNLYFPVANAALWETKNYWTEEYETKFENWMISDKVHARMFFSQHERYHGIKVDCADVVYAFRAVFAYENNLPFSVLNPVYNPRSNYSISRAKYWHNEIKIGS